MHTYSTLYPVIAHAIISLFQNYRLLCPNGNKDSIDNFVNCNWGRIASHIVMTSGIREVETVKLYREFLANISAWFKPTGPHFQKMNLFDSTKYNVYDRSNLLFTDGTNNLWRLPEQTSYYSWVGEYISSGVFTLQTDVVFKLHS